MTPAQTARTEGFLASLAERGITFTLPDGQTVCALVELMKPEQGDFMIGRPTASAARLHVLRWALVELRIGVGTVLTDDGEWTYRVAEIEDLPVNVSVILVCEAAPPP
jgi:hypothetical protein